VLKKLIFVLASIMMVAGLAACANHVAVSKEYAGESDNLRLNVKVWLEYDGDTRIPKGVDYHDEKLCCKTHVEVTYIGDGETADLDIKKIRMGNKMWEMTAQNEDGSDYDFFDQYSAWDDTQQFDIDCIKWGDYYFEMTYQDGSTETVSAQMVKSRGEIKDLDLSF